VKARTQLLILFVRESAGAVVVVFVSSDTGEEALGA
jgi:hypothetical protein